VIAKRKGVAASEVGPEGSMEQIRGPMNKNRMIRPAVPDELATDSEVRIHQGRWW
jgi:hypothetical protein